MFETDNDTTLTISAKNPDTNWVTIDQDGNIISEGKTPKEAIEKAEKISENFSLMFVPKEGNTYIF